MEGEREKSDEGLKRWIAHRKVLKHHLVQKTQ